MAAVWRLLGAAAVLLLFSVLGPAVTERLVGGISTVAVDDPEVLSAAREAVEDYNRRLNPGSNLSKLWRVASASHQVVAGVMYYLKVVLQPTTCRKTAVPIGNLTGCDFQQNPQYAKMCTFKVWDRPWLGLVDVLKTECHRITPSASERV